MSLSLTVCEMVPQVVQVGHFVFRQTSGNSNTRDVKARRKSVFISPVLEES